MRFKLVTFFILLLSLPSQIIALHPNEVPKKKYHSPSSVQPKKGPNLKIMAQGKASPEIMKSFLIRNNEDADAVMVNRLVKVYIIEANREGVNYEVAFCQMCLETGFLKFEGSVSKYQHNYCGLGCVDMFSGGDWFSSMEEGVRAHIQHLKAYASSEPVKSPVVDPRFSNVKRGSVKVVTELTGKWAADPDYGHKISTLVSRLYGL
ncbi:MAG: glucosaminidase domain-containing protein [Bacteroidetes bacterium]|nr:glucosaminidase domain-containing protein [Bacteroidota bacterium]